MSDFNSKRDEAAEKFCQEGVDTDWQSFRNTFKAGADFGYKNGAMDALRCQPDIAHELAEALQELTEAKSEIQRLRAEDFASKSALLTELRSIDAYNKLEVELARLRRQLEACHIFIGDVKFKYLTEGE